jgi:hypothetical protein
MALVMTEIFGYFPDILMFFLFLYYIVAGEGIRILPEVDSKRAESTQHTLYT